MKRRRLPSVYASERAVGLLFDNFVFLLELSGRLCYNVGRTKARPSEPYKNQRSEEKIMPANSGAEVIPARTLNGLYIWLDIAFLLFFLGLLLWQKRILTLLFALFGGVLYFVVDYGIFYRLLGTRVVENADPFWFLLWLSMSYGITNFAWIWLWIRKDEHLLEWSVLILCWWIACPLLSQNFGSGFETIRIYRGTGSYHGVMAGLLFIGYAILCVRNFRKPKEERVRIWWLLIIGVLVQFGWEFSLLITGIRDAGVMPLIVNSLIETNLGIPYIWFIWRAVSRHWQEDGRKIAAEPEAGSEPETETAANPG